jgi:hypothetical protein
MQFKLVENLCYRGKRKKSDDNASTLSLKFHKKIQTEMTYPGQVKVTVIREKSGKYCKITVFSRYKKGLLIEKLTNFFFMKTSLKKQSKLITEHFS